MRRGLITPAATTRRRALAWAMALGLFAAPMTLVESGCGTLCSPDGCADGGAWFLVTGPGGTALAEQSFLVDIETERGTTTAYCNGGAYGPAGICVDEVLFFHEAAGAVAIGEVAFDADTEEPILAMQVFERVPAEDPDVRHTFGPDSLTVRIRRGDEVLVERTWSPTYVREGNGRCGYCDRVEESERIEVDLTAGD